MDSIIFIKEVANLLGYKDRRSVKKWCKRNCVEIFCDEGTSKKYILKMQFDYARLKKIIDYLKGKYEMFWGAALEAHLNENVLHVINFEDNKSNKSVLKKDNYIPSGEHEITFLASLSKQINEL